MPNSVTPKPLDDVAMLGLMLLSLVGCAFLSASSSDHIDWQGCVGLALWFFGSIGLYQLGRRRGL